MRLGIIPAAGKGIRWGGYYKELLPIGNNDWLLNRTIYALRDGGADRIVIVSSIPKITAHVAHLKHMNVFYVIQQGDEDIWSAVKESYPYTEDINLFAMPDTIIPRNTFKREFKRDFALGMFATKKPERFGVLQQNRIIDKPRLPRGYSYPAWGVLVWTKKVVDFWKDQEIQDYTHAINLAMSEFGYDTFELPFYYDMASWDDYWKFLNEGKAFNYNS